MDTLYCCSSEDLWVSSAPQLYLLIGGFLGNHIWCHTCLNVYFLSWFRCICFTWYFSLLSECMRWMCGECFYGSMFKLLIHLLECLSIDPVVSTLLLDNKWPLNWCILDPSWPNVSLLFTISFHCSPLTNSTMKFQFTIP